MSTTYQDKGSLEVETTGSAIEAAAGLAVVVLAIVGLAGRDGGVLMAIAAIILGIGLIAQGGAVTVEHSRLLHTASGGTVSTIELGGGFTAEILAGLAVVILGILAVIGLAPAILTAVVIIVAGAAAIMATAGQRRLHALKLQGMSAATQQIGDAAIAGAISAQLMIGTAAIVLGILALAIPGPAAVLTLVGLLVLGAGVAIAGGTVAGRASSHLFFSRA